VTDIGAALVGTGAIGVVDVDALRATGREASRDC